MTLTGLRVKGEGRCARRDSLSLKGLGFNESALASTAAGVRLAALRPQT
jgi:hypothetical protein